MYFILSQESVAFRHHLVRDFLFSPSQCCCLCLSSHPHVKLTFQKTLNSIIPLGKVLFHSWPQPGPSLLDHKKIWGVRKQGEPETKRWNEIDEMKLDRLNAWIPLTSTSLGFVSLQLGTEDEGLKQRISVASELLAGSLCPSPTLRYHISNPGLSWEFANL